MTTQPVDLQPIRVIRPHREEHPQQRVDIAQLETAKLTRPEDSTPEAAAPQSAPVELPAVPRIAPTVLQEPKGPGDLTWYKLTFSAKLIGVGYDSMIAALDSHGSGWIWRENTDQALKTPPQYITRDEIMQLAAGSDDARSRVKRQGA